ncbi:hypothetical protein B0H14DRAFT_3479436 [Mycena olivaceomarginata]|nr:hypothetical protein B0H14DRAFT_3479436 [Mycena olivaceomarginata]
MPPEPPPTRGNKGYFHGAPLELLLEHLPDYLAVEKHKKDIFWTKFNPVWDEVFPRLAEGSDELQELEDLEESYKEEKEEVKAANERERKTKGRRKGMFRPHPQTSERLNQLRAQAADEVKLKSWFSNAKTKDKTRKVEPFRSWLSRLTALYGPPRRLQMSWVLWQHPEHGEALRIRYQKLYSKDADDEADAERNDVDLFEKDSDGDGDGDGEGGSDGDGDGDGDDSRPGQLLHRKFRLAQAYFEKLTDEEKEQLRDQRERDFEERREAFRKSLKGEMECSPDELAERHRHTEVISQRTLETLCAQMKCKGLLILGEIVEGDDDEVFLSMVTSGSLAKHPGIHFAKWAPVRSKSMLQTFADFLVASKKDEKGLLGSLLDPGPPATAASTAPALCSQCLGGLTRLDSQPPPDTPSVASKARKTAGKKKRAAKEKSTGGRKSAGKRKRKDQEEEEEAADSGAEEEEDGWRASGEDTEDQEDELESSTHATSHREGDEGECNEEEPCTEL